jgi:hypothetical protein
MDRDRVATGSPTKSRRQQAKLRDRRRRAIEQPEEEVHPHTAPYLHSAVDITLFFCSGMHMIPNV